MKMSRCEDEKMLRRCEDEKMLRRCEDEQMFRRCEDEKMFYRPPLLEEPCAQTLSGKTEKTIPKIDNPPFPTVFISFLSSLPYCHRFQFRKFLGPKIRQESFDP